MGAFLLQRERRRSSCVRALLPKRKGGGPEASSLEEKEEGGGAPEIVVSQDFAPVSHSVSRAANSFHCHCNPRKKFPLSPVELL